MKPLPQFLLLKQPLYICAPMVDQSQLAFRLLTRRHGCNLAYTPMLHSKMMVSHKKYKKQNFQTCAFDRPLVAQFCGDDPSTLLKAARMIQNQVDAIDLNFGCPQAIAKRGHYGSYLLQEKQLIKQIVQTLSKGLSIPVFCKIRILPREQDTLKLVRIIQQSGCKLLTVHGRTKQMNKQRVGDCDCIPVVANGGIFTLQDVQNCINTTKVDGVMSAEGLLQNPALFSGKKVDLDQLAQQYLQIVTNYQTNISSIRGHLFKMLFNGLNQNIDLREKMSKVKTIPQFKQITLQLKQRRKNQKYQQKFGWYKRYWKRKQQIKNKMENQIQKGNKIIQKNQQQLKKQ